jgi:DUF177 domain-containing protein
MRIEIDKLEEHGGKFERLYDAKELPLDDPEVRLVEPAEVSGRVRREGTEVALSGQLRAKLEVVCGRCLQPVELPISADFSERFVRTVSWAADEQHELQPEDLNISVFDGEALELDDLVREELLLAVPVNVLCREDCKGLCPSCGIDRNLSKCQCEAGEVDSRWQKLKELQM